MMVETVSIATMRTDLRTPWPTVEGPVSVRESAFLLLHSGPVGGLERAAVGESAPMPGFGLESFAASVAAQTAAVTRTARMKCQCTSVKSGSLSNESADGKRLTRA